MRHRSKKRVLKRGISNGWETKKRSTFLAIREMQIKPTLRFHLKPQRIAKIKKHKC